jgi:spore maturation protein CgeB
VIPCIHEPHARLYGVEVRERLYKVPLAGGFTVTDPVASIYEEGFFTPDEIPMARTGKEMAQMVEHFVRRRDDRRPFVQRARSRVLNEHTYFHRISKLMTELGRLEAAAAAILYVQQHYPADVVGTGTAASS